MYYTFLAYYFKTVGIREEIEDRYNNSRSNYYLGTTRIIKK